MSATNNDINLNTTSAKGLEKAVGIISRFFIKIQSKINEIFYGKAVSKRQDANLIKRLLNKGIIPLLDSLTSVDFCNILNYAASNIPDATDANGKKIVFDPTKDAPSDNIIARKKWQLQKTAYDVQQFIDEYYREYLDTNNPQSRVGLFLLIQQINSSFSSVVNQAQVGLNDPLIVENFPQASVASNFLQNVLGRFNTYTDVNQIPIQEVQKLIDLVDKVRQYCIIIQAFNNPKNAIGLIDSSLNGAIQRELSDISKLILNPNKALSVLKSIIKTVNTVNSISQKILGFINTLRALTKLCISVIGILNIVINFLLLLPISNLLTTIGITTKFADTLQKIKQVFQKKLIERLEQISAVLNLAAIVVTSLVAGIQNIIGKLQIIQQNLDSCSNKNENLVNEIKDTINSLTNTSQQLNDFLTQYNNQQERSQTQFGKYLIQIVTEQVVDEAINLRRRYGIARDTNGFIVAQSTPTFASLDLIIINEVKALLVSKGLVSANLSGLSSDQQVIVLEAARFLGEDEIDLTSIELNTADIETLQDEELGISTFVNNLPGGAALRRRIREKMLRNSRKLATDLQSTDPGGRFSSGIIKQQQSERNKLEIQNLESQISEWKKEIALAATQGLAGVIVIRDRTKKIKDAERKIQELRQG